MFSIVVSIISANLIYPMTAMVTDVNYDTNIVTIETVSGVEWQFEGCEDWDVGDLAECIMWSNDTKIIYDDVILCQRYGGHVMQFNEMYDKIISVEEVN